MTSTPTRPYVCLSMIVRNERHVIARCLRSALPLIDAAVIADTGSTDDTAEQASAVLQAARVPSRVLDQPWQDFGANRTAAIRAAEQTVTGFGWPLDHVYWLFLDADLELVIAPAFSRDTLQGDAIAVRQDSSRLSYWNLRLARASLQWSAVGRTHEHYASPEAPAIERRHDLTIRDHHDGASHRDKFARDIRWLSEDMASRPDCARTTFYLAQSHLGAGDPLKALLLYRRRAAMGGSPEEAWYATLSAGTILAESDHLALATAALTEAHTAAPSRAEPLYELARLHRRHGRTAEAAAYAYAGATRRWPEDGMFFVHRDVYEYEAALELAWSACGTPHATHGFAAADRVAWSRTAPANAIDAARSAWLTYVQPLQGMTFLPIRPDLPPPYRPCNPSILRTPSGYLVNCRAVNYEQRRLHYRSLDDDERFRTRNVLLDLDADFGVRATREVTDAVAPRADARVLGLEDCRILMAEGRLGFLAATADRHPSGRVHQSICWLDRDGLVVEQHPLVGAFDDAHQKNWLPFTEHGALLAIHGYDPLRIVSVDPRTGAYRVVLERASPIRAGDWRGSAGPVAWPGDSRRRLVLVHEVVLRQGPDEGWERVYLHRFVEYGDDWRVMRVSRPFVFAHKGVEFACGMAPTLDDRDLVIAFGIEDRDAYLGRLSFAGVDTLLDDGMTL